MGVDVESVKFEFVYRVTHYKNQKDYSELFEYIKRKFNEQKRFLKIELSDPGNPKNPSPEYVYKCYSLKL